MGAMVALIWVCIIWLLVIIILVISEIAKTWRYENMDTRNPQAREFFEGYRQAQREILEMGIEAFTAKYAEEWNDNSTIHFRGMKKSYINACSRLEAMLKRGQ